MRRAGEEEGRKRKEGKVQSEGERRGATKVPGVYGCRVTETHTRSRHSTLELVLTLVASSCHQDLSTAALLGGLLKWAHMCLQEGRGGEGRGGERREGEEGGKGNRFYSTHL